jgi:hypothetical protein
MIDCQLIDTHWFFPGSFTYWHIGTLACMLRMKCVILCYETPVGNEERIQAESFDKRGDGP